VTVLLAPRGDIINGVQHLHGHSVEGETRQVVLIVPLISLHFGPGISALESKHDPDQFCRRVPSDGEKC
jgi:hypothetical protein